MKITKRQLRQVIKEEKQKILEEQGAAPGAVIADTERLLIAVALQSILDQEGFIESKIFQAMHDIGYDDPDIERAIDQLMDRHNLL